MIGRKFINRYEVIRHLGEGSTATVYLAKDLRLGRDVALKILLPHVQESARKRFFQEAEAAAQLNHPNIMSLYDIDEDHNSHFLVVEYIDGVSLSKYVPSSVATIVDLGSQIARALHYAHENGVIHRDIKPANIQVTPARQVKIMDLGLALPREAKRVTAHGMVIGTPAYLSPEQAQGLELDRRTDIYSLGIVLFEMATGELPFSADDIGALLLQQVRQPAPKPSTFNPDIPIALENIIMRTLEKKPDRRYQTADALANALEAVVELPDAGKRPAPDPALGHRHTATVDIQQRTIRVLLADDHNVLRKTLVSFLEQREDFVVVGEANDGASALRETVMLLPDVLILDLNMPGMSGLEVLPKIRQEAPSVKVLVLTGREEEWYIVQALSAGANGYLMKSGDEQEIIDGIEKVMQGQLVLGAGVPERMVDGIIGKKNEAGTALTESERQVLLYVAAGYENDEIARRISMPLPTLIETLAQSMNKLKAKDRHAAALKALRSGLISLEALHEL